MEIVVLLFLGHSKSYLKIFLVLFNWIDWSLLSLFLFKFQIWVQEIFFPFFYVICLWSPLSPKHMQDIFINSFRTCIYLHGTYPNPFSEFWLKMYGSSKAEEGNHRHWILSGNGKRERLGFCSIQKCDITKWTDPWPFISSYLKDHTHWAIGPDES